MPTLLAVISVLSLSGVVHSLTGFGFGLVAMALLPLWLDLPDSTAIVTVFNLLVSVPTFLANRAHYTGREGWGLVAGACLGVPPGALLLRAVEPAWLLRTLGLLLVVFALGQLLRGRCNWRVPRCCGFPLGLACGSLAGAFNVGGPPAIIYAYSQPRTRRQAVAVLQVVFAAVGGVRLAMFGATGLLDEQLVWISAWSVLPVVFGIAGGTLLLRRICPHRLQAVVDLFLIVMGIKYILWA